jgi:hypothetical protein
MGDQFFDDLAKGLDDGTVSRSRALKLTAGALLGSALIPLFSSSPAEARRRRNPCRGKTPLCEGGSTENCKGTSGCFCARTVEGGKKCVDFTRVSCPTTDECNSSADCASDEFCIDVSGCCPSTGSNNACAPKCG